MKGVTLNESTESLIPRRWKTPVRALTLAFSAVLIALYVAGIPVRFSELNQVCTEPHCSAMILMPADVAVLQESGLTISAYAAFQIGMEVFMATLLIGLASLIFWRRSDTWIGVITTAALVWFGVNFLSEGDEALARLYPSFALTQALLYSTGSLSLILLAYLFPSGRFSPRWTRWVAFAGAVLSLLPLGYAIVLARAQPDAVRVALAGIVPIVLATGVYGQVYRYRNVSNNRERQQTKWVILGMATTATAGILWTLTFELFPLPPGSIRLWTNVFGLISLALLILVLPVSLVIAILRYRLWEIDILIRRTLIYGALTGTLAAVYFASIVLLQRVLPAQSQLATVLSTLTIAALFSPLRRRIQDNIDRLFYRRKFNMERTLAEFSTALRQQVDLEELSASMLRVVSETVQPKHTSLWLADRDDRVSRS